MLKVGFMDIIRKGMKQLYPGYFALVMATGIVSISVHLLGMSVLTHLLFQINVCAYCILLLLTVDRLFSFFRGVLGDLTDHRSGPGFFTTIAVTTVLGSQFVIPMRNDCEE